MINNRQAGRRRGRGNNNNGGGGQRQGGQGGRDSGNRIDNRARGNASQLYEKYKNLARDAQMSGDRVNIEYYLQFADHYFRVLSEQRSRFEENQPQHQREPRRQQPFDLDGDDEYGDEGEPIRSGEQQGDQQQARQNGHDRNPERNQERGDRQPRGDQRGERQQRPRDDDQQPQFDQPRAETPRRAPRAALKPVGEDEAQRTVTPANDSAETAPVAEEAPRRRGRPRRDRSADEGQDVTPAALDADRLPPSLGVSASAPAVDAPLADAGEKPRRRRVRAASEVSSN